MTKAALIAIMQEYPDNTDVLFTLDVKNGGEDYPLTLEYATDCTFDNYINLYFKYRGVQS